MPERVENLMSGTYEHNKIKTPYAHIIVEGTCEKPYFEIEYYDFEKETTFIGYGSYDLSNVFRWLEKNFEVEKPTADVAPVVHAKWENCDWVGPDYHGCGTIRIPNAGMKCTNCIHVLKKDLLWVDNYCPCCGAKMDLEDDKQ